MIIFLIEYLRKLNSIRAKDFSQSLLVICIAGDGSLQMNIQELQTVKHYSLPIKLFVLNNGGYHSIIQTQRNFFGDELIGCNEESGVSFPSLKKIAIAYDLKYSLILLSLTQ